MNSWPASSIMFFSLICYQCSDLNVGPDEVEQQKIGFKGIITIPKPIQFKSSIKDCRQVMLKAAV